MDATATNREPLAWFGALLVAYAWLCIGWFDHGVVSLERLRAPTWLPLMTLGLIVVAVALRYRWIPTLGRFAASKDGRIGLALASAAIVSRLPFLSGAYGLFSSDAAVQGVMALHILEGRHHPVFLYRWSYVGSFKAHLTAAIAKIIGEPVLAFVLAAIVVFALYVVALYALARSVLDRPAAIAAASYAIVSSGFLTAWSMHNEGNYLDVMLFGTLSMAALARWLASRGTLDLLGAGICVGLAFWTHILATYYLLLAIVVVGTLGLDAIRSWAGLLTHVGRVASRLVVLGFGFIAGDLPALLWNGSNEWLSFRWWSVGATASAASADAGVDGRWRLFADQLFDVFGTATVVLAGWWPRDHPPWPSWLWAYVLLLPIPLAVLGFCWLHRAELSRLRRLEIAPATMMLVFFALVVVVFSLSSFGWMSEEPRYLLFVFSVAPIFFAACGDYLWRRSRTVAAVLAAALLFVHLHGSFVYWKRAKDSDAVNRAFVGALEELGIDYAQTDYHIAYKYVFLSHGRFVWTSELGPAQTQWYLPFRDELSKAPRIALVPRSHRMARRLERRLDAKKITYKREDLLYPILYDFSERVTASDVR